jgi:hypothetical protein
MSVQERNIYNDTAEKTNMNSIRTTRSYERELLAGRIPPTTQDVGPRLVAYYGYTEDEWSRMVDDQEYCQHVVHPVPARLMDVIMKRRKEIAAKKKVDEEKAKEKRSMLQGSMKMSGVIEINPLTRPPVVIPDSFLTAIKLKLHPALFWFTDRRLRFAEDNPGEIPTKKNQGVSEEKALLDITKLKATWGSDDRVEGVSVLTWTNAMENFIDALRVLSAEPDSTCPHSYAEERQKHFHFVKNLDDFEALFPVWYPVERSLRNKILTNNRAYSESHWSNEIGMVLNAHKAATNIQKGSYYSSAPIRIADLLPHRPHLHRDRRTNARRSATTTAETMDVTGDATSETATGTSTATTPATRDATSTATTTVMQAATHHAPPPATTIATKDVMAFGTNRAMAFGTNHANVDPSYAWSARDRTRLENTRPPKPTSRPSPMLHGIRRLHSQDRPTFSRCPNKRSLYHV